MAYFKGKDRLYIESDHHQLKRPRSLEEEDYLEEQAEADPLIVLVNFHVGCVRELVHTKVRNVFSDLFEKGTFDKVCMHDPAIRIENIFWNFFRMDAVNGIADILTCGDNQGESQEDHHRQTVVQAEDGRVDSNMAHLYQVFQASENVQHFTGSHIPWIINNDSPFVQGSNASLIIHSKNFLEETRAQVYALLNSRVIRPFLACSY